MNSRTHPLPSLRSGLPPLCFATRGKTTDIHKYTFPLLYDIGGRGMSTCYVETLFKSYTADSGYSIQFKWLHIKIPYFFNFLRSLQIMCQTPIFGSAAEKIKTHNVNCSTGSYEILR